MKIKDQKAPWVVLLDWITSIVPTACIVVGITATYNVVWAVQTLPIVENVITFMAVIYAILAILAAAIAFTNSEQAQYGRIMLARYRNKEKAEGSIRIHVISYYVVTAGAVLLGWWPIVVAGFVLIISRIVSVHRGNKTIGGEVFK